jgi:hypothetical protein
MAAGASIGDTDVVECRRLKADGALVTDFASLGRRHVRRHSGSFTLRHNIVVTGRTAGRDPAVVHRRARTECNEIRGRVAEFTRLVGDDVVRERRLPLCCRAVVA